MLEKLSKKLGGKFPATTLSSSPWADTLSWWWSLCASMALRAVPVGTAVPGRSNHAGLVEG